MFPGEDIDLTGSVQAIGCRNCPAHYPRRVIYCPYCGQPQHDGGAPRTEESGSSLGLPGLELNEVVKGVNSSTVESAEEVVDGELPTEPIIAEHNADGELVPDQFTKQAIVEPVRSKRGFAVSLGVGAILVISIMVVARSWRDAGPQTGPNASATPGRSAVANTSLESQPAQQAAFCEGAQTPDEQAICDNDGLAALQSGVDSLYNKLRDHNSGTVPDEVANYVSAALANRHECGKDADCISGILLAEKMYLSDQVNKAGAN